MGTKVRKRVFLAAFAVVISTAAFVSAQVRDTAYVPFVVNVDATVRVARGSTPVTKAVTQNVEVTLAVPLSASNIDVGISPPIVGGGDPPLGGSGGGDSIALGVINGVKGNRKAPVMVSSRNGNVVFRLSPQLYQNAEVALHSVNGKRLLRGKATASEAGKSIAASGYLTAGVYLLSVKGVDGNTFASKVAHRGGALDISVAFSNETKSPSRNLAKAMAETATVTVSASGYVDSSYSLSIEKGTGNPKQTITLRQAPVTPPSTDTTTNPPLNPPNIAKADFTETVGGVSFDMIYIPGGTFTLGCESNCQNGAAPPISGVNVSSYWIMKGEASASLWRAVVGTSHAGGTWYEAVEFACELSKKTGKNYRMMTEAEFEYAAKKYKSKLSNIGGNGMQGEEWAYNSWSADRHSGGTDPVGPSSGQHTQKTRRDADSEGSDRVTSRLIRSIDGIGPATRLVVSADMAYPPGYVPSCDIHAPVLGGEPANSYRDPRWITGDSFKWGTGSIAIGDFNLQVWEDGTAKLGSTVGQWFTSNNIAFVFVPSSGTPVKYPYIFLDDKQGSVIGEGRMMSAGGYIGRFEKKAATGTKPTVSGLKSGKDLAEAQTKFADEYKMVDMESLPKTAAAITSSYKQDSRLLDGGAAKGWFQDNTSMNGAHHYRKDVDLDAFRFTVNQAGQRAAVLAAGKWFTINNTFLRVIHDRTGYIADYLYTVAEDGTFYHNSFMGYERADFRMFKKVDNASMPRTNCGNICGEEIPKDVAPAAMYVNDREKGQSTFVPAKCPTGGCR
ncbi:MAG: formylglycine-generating enzyme family protein [Chitinispirillales bacterium]|jgi:hypothetical protein|nr:formylglycine-generating enzyme family protein [Chitinispirillales bacterium]